MTSLPENNSSDVLNVTDYIGLLDKSREAGKVFLFCFFKTALSCLTLIRKKQVKPSFAFLAPTSSDLQHSPHVKNDTDVESVTEAPFQSLTGIIIIIVKTMLYNFTKCLILMCFPTFSRRGSTDRGL